MRSINLGKSIGRVSFAINFGSSGGVSGVSRRISVDHLHAGICSACRWTHASTIMKFCINSQDIIIDVGLGWDMTLKTWQCTSDSVSHADVVRLVTAMCHDRPMLDGYLHRHTL